ncbi:MarR family winged helix-turn-helix transcriptional regulator [Glycomyces tenuis]|uniref:MarR family winged helix-turn-helix transcriptional regulator n=1 Tax=Glycomyces tenuis TaxID=58116 RepID=UPI00047E16A5|nr:MarR family transcriptional regulator [Glycomyces tenuis]
MTPGETPQAPAVAGEVTDRLRELTVQLSLLNHQIAGLLGLQDVDLDCLDIISREGPLTPGTLARQAGLHPATTTGVLDRLERAGRVRRERVPSDRRAVHVQAVPGRGDEEILALYGPMITRLGEICADFTDTELATVADFLRRATEAGRATTAEVADR